MLTFLTTKEAWTIKFASCITLLIPGVDTVLRTCLCRDRETCWFDKSEKDVLIATIFKLLTRTSITNIVRLNVD